MMQGGLHGGIWGSTLFYLQKQEVDSGGSAISIFLILFPPFVPLCWLWFKVCII